MTLWPPLPPEVGITPLAVDVLVALPSLNSAWGRSQWGVGTWGGYAFGDTTPMDCDVQGIEIERGRSDPLAHIQAAGLRMTVQDPERRWAPWVIPPDGFRQWRSGVPLQVRTPEGVLFTGAVTTIKASEKPEADFERSVEIAALDPLMFLAASDQNEQAEQGGNELAGDRLERIWANALPPAWVEHRYDPGIARMQATTLARGALDESWLTADSEAGMLSCTPDGIVQYWDTNLGLADPRRVVPQVTFTDNHDYVADTPTVCTTKFDIVDDAGQVVNWISIAAKDGAAEVASDGTSISYYGRRSTQRHDLIHNEGQTFSKSVAEKFLERVTKNAVIITPLEFNALASPEAWAAAHTLDVADRVAVHREVDGYRLDITASIDQITHRITPYSWEVQIQLAPGTQRSEYSRWGRALWGVNTWS